MMTQAPSEKKTKGTMKRSEKSEDSEFSGINLHFQDGEEEEVKHERREIGRLENAVKEMERKTVALEGKLIEMYGIKEQRSCIAQLEKHLKVKTAEADVLSITVNSLTARRGRNF